MPGEQQVTPKTAPERVKALQQLARRGNIRVTSNRFPTIVMSGRTCHIVPSRRNTQVIECRESGRIISIQIQDKGFEPSRDGESVVYFEIAKDKVCIRLDIWRLGVV